MKLLLIGLIFITSCTILPERSRERQLQTDIINSLKSNSSDLTKCVQKSDLFKKLNQERIRVSINLSINSNSEIEKFRLNETNYPSEFSECIFKIVSKIKYPKIKGHELIELEQPFIFSKK